MNTRRALSILALALLLSCQVVGPQVSSEPAGTSNPEDPWVLELGDLIARFDPEDGRVLHLTGESGEEPPLELLLEPELARPARLGTLQLAVRADASREARLMRLPGSEASVQVTAREGEIRALWRLEDPPLEVTSTFRGSDQEPDLLLWDVEIANRSPAPVVLGELGFPFPANTNYYSGFDQTDQGLKRLFARRLYQTRHVGGRSSYLLCRRLRGDFPALILTCGAGTELEFTYMEKTDWEGIPVLLEASRATRERLGMTEDWLNGHRELEIDPGTPHRMSLELRLLVERPHYRGADDLMDRAVRSAVARSGGVALEAIPGMTIPRGEEWLVRLTTRVPPREIRTEPAAPLEQRFGPRARILATRFERVGPAMLLVEDDQGETNRFHLRVIDPPRELIRRRARFIAENQVMRDPESPLHGAILVWDRMASAPLEAPDSYWGGGGYEGGICEALFLAEKNVRIPDREEIAVLERYVREYLLRLLQNPGSGEVAWFFPDGVTPYKIGRPYNYAHVVGFHRAMYRIGRLHGALESRTALEYLDLARQTFEAMMDRSWRWHLTHVGLMGAQVFYELPADLRREGRIQEARRIEEQLRWRAQELLSRDWPYSAEPLYDTTGYEEIYFAGRFLRRFDHMARTLRCAMAQKSLTPTWFWNGTDKRYWDAMEPNPGKGYYGTDMGETCFHYTAPLTAMVGLDDFTHPRFFREEGVLARCYASLLGVLNLIHPDGSGSMCYTPDPNSNHQGFNRYSGDLGLGLTGYLRASTALVHDLRLGPSAYAAVGYGCRVQEEPGAVIAEPYDGVQQRVQWPVLEYDVRVSRGRILRARLPRDKRSVTVDVQNDTPFARPVQLVVRGLWGRAVRVTVDDRERPAAVPVTLEGCAVSLEIPAGESRRVLLRSVSQLAPPESRP